MALITCSDLTLGYENIPVAQHLSFTVEEGDYLCIVGENGSGKSTLMKTLLGLKAPLSGSVAFGGGLRPTEIGYLPQQTPLQRDFPASVQEVVLSGCLGRCGWRPFYSRAEKALAAQNMDRLGITGLARRTAEEEGLPLQFEVMAGTTGTDADEIAVSGCGVRTVLFSIPQRYMHTPVEVIDPADVEAAAALIVAFCRALADRYEKEGEVC